MSRIGYGIKGVQDFESDRAHEVLLNGKPLKRVQRPNVKNVVGKKELKQRFVMYFPAGGQQARFDSGRGICRDKLPA